MKKLMLFLSFLFVVIFCNAQMTLDRSNGEYVIVFPEGVREHTGITIEEGTQEYIEYFDQVVLNPGTKILVKESKEMLRLKLLFKKVVVAERKYLLYDDINKTIGLVESEPEEEETTSYIMLLGLISIILALVSNIFLKNSNKLVLALAICFAFFTFLTAFALITVTSAGFACLALLLFNFFNSDEVDSNFRRIFLVVYYVGMLLWFLFSFFL